MRGRKKLVALAAVSALALAACSSSKSGSDDSSGGSGAIKVAVLCSCSGPFGQFVIALRHVADSWAKSVNASGGINGHQVKLLNYDDAGDAGKAVTQAQDAISAHADVVLDASPLDAAWAKTVDAAKIPVVGGELNSKLYSTDTNFYPSGQTPDSISESLVATAKAAGAKTIGALYCTEAPSCLDLVAPFKSIGDQLGVPNVYKASISATAPNYTAQCVAAKNAGVSALAIADVSAAIVKVGGDCDRQGFDPIYVTAGTGFAMSMAKAAGVGKNLWSAYPTLPFFSDAPIVKTMQQTVEKYHPGLQAKDDAWSQVAVQAWTGGLLIEAAVKAGGSGDVSAATITSGLNSLKNETLGGWSPPLSFTAGQPHVVNCWFTAQVENGTPTVTNGGKTTCGS
jgi:branched-chain amino acid transport system substrate-binding protein